MSVNHIQNRIGTRIKRRARGMTLVELMIVVVIVGILSVLAVSGFRKYTISARNTEAHNFLGSIRASQEAYFQSFGRYCGTVAETKWPLTVPIEQKVQWEQPPNGAWRDLGIKSPGAVWFQYVLRAGGPNEAAGAAFDPQPTTAWYQATAHSDFNRDGILSTFEVTSATNIVYSIREGD